MTLSDSSEESYTYYLQRLLNEILPRLDVWRGYAEFLKGWKRGR